MKVERIKPGDNLNAVLELIRAAFAEQAGKIDPPSSMNTLSVLDISKQLETQIIFGVRDGADLAGCVFTTRKTQALYLSKLSVHPGARGRGIAGALMDASEAHAKDLGLPWLEVIARVELIENHKMFERFGYVQFAEGRHPGYERTTELHFRKPI